MQSLCLGLSNANYSIHIFFLNDNPKGHFAEQYDGGARRGAQGSHATAADRAAARAAAAQLPSVPPSSQLQQEQQEQHEDEDEAEAEAAVPALAAAEQQPQAGEAAAPPQVMAAQAVAEAVAEVNEERKGKGLPPLIPTKAAAVGRRVVDELAAGTAHCYWCGSKQPGIQCSSYAAAPKWERIVGDDGQSWRWCAPCRVSKKKLLASAKRPAAKACPNGCLGCVGW